jgi:hypothetical protein
MNVDYGFSVDVPAGLVGERIAPPAPNHGFAITLEEKSTVWVDASYEMPDSLRKHNVNARLGWLKAELKVWKTTESGRDQFHKAIIARGFDRGTPIIYTIQVDTASEHDDPAYRAFEAIIRSFRNVPIRPEGAEVQSSGPQ